VKLYSFDASSIVDLWVNYPINNPHFKSVWEWFERHVNDHDFVISDVALNEVKQEILYENLIKDIPESKLFIEILKNISTIQKSSSDLITVGSIKKIINIEEDNYHSKGVGENDLLIISIAKRSNTILVTNEGRQSDIQNIKVKGKYKIPVVCNLKEVKVSNINLTELLLIDTLW